MFSIKPDKKSHYNNVVFVTFHTDQNLGFCCSKVDDYDRLAVTSCIHGTWKMSAVCSFETLMADIRLYCAITQENCSINI